MKVETTNSNFPSKDGKIASTILDAFAFLKSPKEEQRIIGGTKIISLLQGNENDKERKYVLKRLIRSVGANRPEFRTGYYSVLVKFLKVFDVTLTQVLDIIKSDLSASGSSKSEVGDVSLGQIIVCGAVFRSGLIFKSPLEDQTEIIKLLSTASTKKSYLSVVAYKILLDFVINLNEEQFSSIVWSTMKSEFKKELKEHNLDTLYFLIVTSKKFPKVVKVRKLLGVESVICENTLHEISEKIMAGIDYNSINHPIFQEIALEMANSPHLKVFWTSAIDGRLLKHNRNRELVALNMLLTILNNMTQNYELLPEFLSNNFFRLFMDWFKGLQTASKIRNKRDDEEDNKIMIKKEREVLNALAKVLKSDKVNTKIRIDTLKKLLFHPGDMNFSDITATSITKSIISDLDANGVKKIAKLFEGVLLNSTKKFIKEDVERSWYNNERLKAAEGLSYLVMHDAMKDETDFKLNYMKLLMCLGFFQIDGDEDVALSADLTGSIKACFYRCFGSRFSNVDNMVEVLSSLSAFINTTLEKDVVREKLEKQFPKENTECWELVTGICQTIEKNKNKSKVDKVFLILLYQLGLFLFSEPKHVEMATESIKELKSCYEHYKKAKEKKQKQLKEGDLVEGDPEWIEVVVEVLLSILSTDSSVLRAVVQCVFRLLNEYLTPSAVVQIVSVLDPEMENNPLKEGDEQSEDEEEEESDAEEIDKKENGDALDEAEDDSDEEMSDDDTELKTPDQLRMAIQKALGASQDSDAESINADMIDEEEGRNLDDALAEAFKQFSGKGMKSKKERKDKKAVSDFRIRVLDLIDIYLEKDPSMDITLSLMEPLIRSLEYCLEDNSFIELERRLRKTIRNLTKIKKFSSTDNVTVDLLCDYLNSTIDKGGRSHFMFQALGDVVTQCATFLIHCSQKIDTSSKSAQKACHKMIEIFKESLKSYFLNRNCLLPIIFFHSVLQTDWNGVYDMIPVVIESAFNGSVRQFRRNEALELLSGFYRSLKRLKPSTSELLNKISNIETEFENTVKRTLSSNSEEFSAKKNYFVILKKLINTMNLYHESCHVKSSVDFKALLDNISSNKSAFTVKNNNSIDVKEVTQNGDISVSKKSKRKKRKAEISNGHAEPSRKTQRRTSVVC